MSVDGNSYDAVVIGGGFAGVVAARDLTKQGNRVLLLEARDRLGGRTWSSTFPGTDVEVELGGTFVFDSWHNVARERERYGVGVSTVPPSTAYPTLLNGTFNPGPSPVPLDQIFELERAAIHCVLAASRITPGMPIDHQGLEDLDIPVSEFLEPLGLPKETYDFVTAIFTMLSFRDPADGSALQTLISLASFDLSPMQLWGAVEQYLPTATLVERIAADVTEVRLSTPVARVDQTGDQVVITTVDGQTVTAAAVVVATPMNIWNDIEFLPQLSEEKRVASAERHGCDRSGKFYVRVRNVDGNPFLVAGPEYANGAFMIFGDHYFDNGDLLMTMFGLTSREGDNYHLAINDHDSIVRSVEAMLPGVEVVDTYAHDFNTDPYSKGDWISWRPGRVSRSHSLLGAPEGRLAFATADVAPKWLMMIEGAVECGHRAANQTANVIAQVREAALVRS